MPARYEPWKTSKTDRVKLTGPACVAYGHPDLVKIHEYLTNFGLQKVGSVAEPVESVFYRGYGIQPVVYIARKTEKPRFLGVYFEAASMEELFKAAKIPGAGLVKKLDHPGGGSGVEIVDPAGLPFHVIWGMDKVEFCPPTKEILPFNYPAKNDADEVAKPRRGQFQRLTRGIVPVHKFGHCGYRTNKFDESVEFYTTQFNFKPTDIILGPDSTHIFMFMHVDLGKEYSDHHSFFLQPSSISSPHHSAFEVEDIDKQFVAHEHLQRNGYKPFWGIGRHVLGSQIFDYWYDHNGFLVEHYADGDLVNEDTPIEWVNLADGGNNWGPDVPSELLSL